MYEQLLTAPLAARLHAELCELCDLHPAEAADAPFDAAEFAARTARVKQATALSPVEIRLEPFQERLLEQIEVSRLRGHHRDLLVSATGTGKTVMSAVWYARLRAELPRARLLFVAHRKELLEQARATFRQHLRDGAFGEMWGDGRRPVAFQHVFASVQSLRDLSHLAPDHFDVVIVDGVPPRRRQHLPPPARTPAVRGVVGNDRDPRTPTRPCSAGRGPSASHDTPRGSATRARPRP